MEEKIVKIIVEETNAMLDESQELNKESQLFGTGGLLDSMGLVGMVVAVEQDVEDEFGVSITIANAKAMSQKHSPFATVGSLATYIVTLVEAAK